MICPAEQRQYVRELNFEIKSPNRVPDWALRSRRKWRLAAAYGVHDGVST